METVRKSHTPKSTFISKIEYSCLPTGKGRNSELITVWFFDNGQIEYKPPIVMPPAPPFDFEAFYNRFISAPSVGKFWHKEIKDKLEWKRIK